MRKLSWIIAGILCTTPAFLPAFLQAAELGGAQVSSHLTERLKAQIPLTGLNGVSPEDIKVQLAPESYYRQAGLSLDSLAGNISFQVKTEGAKSFILMSSKRIITDPILSILVQVSTGNSQTIKEFELLLNPPVRGVANPATLAHANESPNAALVAAPAAQIADRDSVPNGSKADEPLVQNTPRVSLGGTYQVQPGDTLFSIAKSAVADSRLSVQSMMQAIINANGNAFVAGKGNEMLSGATLKVPTLNEVNRLKVAPRGGAKSTANEKPLEQASATTQPKLMLLSADDHQSTPAATTLAVPSAESPAPQVQGAGIDTVPSSTASAPALNDAALPATELGTAPQNEAAADLLDEKNQAMSHQVTLLNEQLKQVQSQLTERDQNIQHLQQKVKVAEEQTQVLKKQLESQSNNFWVQWSPYLLGTAGLLIILLLLVALSRGRQRSDRFEQSSYPSPIMNKSVADSNLVKPPAEQSLAPVAAATVSAGVSAPIFQSQAPAFDAQSMVDEARLLRSYHLHEQAFDILRDSLAQHPQALPLYQALAQFYSEDEKTVELEKVLEQIDLQFGSEHRPDLAAGLKPAAPNTPQDIFDEPIAPAAPETADLPSLDALDAMSPAVFSSYNLDIPRDEPLADRTDAVVLPKSDLADIDFDLPSLDVVEMLPIAVSESQPLVSDLSLELDVGHFGEVVPPAIEQVSSESLDFSATASEVQNDTRLGLAEAFLGVGDRESYQMIADEIESEGDPDLIAALRSIELKYEA